MRDDIKKKLTVIEGGRKKHRVQNPPRGYTIYIDDNSQYLNRIIRLLRWICIWLLIIETCIIITFGSEYSKIKAEVIQLENKYKQIESCINADNEGCTDR